MHKTQVNQFPVLEQIREGVDWNCNKLRLEELVASQVSELTFYCGGMSNTFDVWDVFDLVIMLTDEATIKRLLARQPERFWKHQGK